MHAPDHLPARIVLLFLDGVGIGPDDPTVNPFAAASFPGISRLVGGRRLVDGELDMDRPLDAPGAAAAALDARLGIPGIPQSGTGQTSLLTGTNAALHFGRHFGPWVPTSLRPMLRQENVLASAAMAGRAVAFANAHPPSVPIDRRPAGPTVAAASVDALWRGAPELRGGEAVASSITNERWITSLPHAAVEPITPEEAAINLTRIAATAELTLFAHYDTDFLGHRGSLADAVALLERIDRFVSGLLEHLPADTLLALTSDHGNLEDVRAGHTCNPVPLLTWGPGSRELVTGLRSITDVAPRLLRLLRVG